MADAGPRRGRSTAGGNGGLRIAAVLVVTTALGGCGLAGTTVATGAGAASSAEQAKQSRQQLDKFQERLDAAQKAEADARAAAERAAE